MTETILIVDDEEGIRSALAGILEDEGYRTVCAADGIEALALCKRELPGLVLLDIWMPRMDGLETLRCLKELYPSLNVIMMSGHGTIETAVKSTKLGAYDFIEKPLSLEKVVVTVENALAMTRLKEENASLRGLVLQSHEMIGNSAAMLRLKEQIRMVAPTNASVLITGENGTGKELVARSVHFQSLRRDKPFIEINCAAIPEELIESELFGHERGAFTGAVQQKKGRFEVADTGTLFLDEIGEMPLDSQVKLLRVLQDGTFHRVGGNQPLQTDVRLITATNRNLKNEVLASRFRMDLYFRLNVVNIVVPPLRERREDIPLLAKSFIDRLNRKHHQNKELSDGLVQALRRQDWPGNVRELENAIEKLYVLSNSRVVEGDGTALESTEVIATASTTTANPSEFAARPPTADEAIHVLIGLPVDEVEKRLILATLAHCGGNKSKAARQLQIGLKTLYRKLESYGVKIGDDEVTASAEKA